MRYSTPGAVSSLPPRPVSREKFLEKQRTGFVLLALFVCVVCIVFKVLSLCLCLCVCVCVCNASVFMVFAVYHFLLKSETPKAVKSGSFF